MKIALRRFFYYFLNLYFNVFLHSDCVQLLVSGGASLAVKTISGRTPLMLAARADHRDIVQVKLVFGWKIFTVYTHQCSKVFLEDLKKGKRLKYRRKFT